MARMYTIRFTGTLGVWAKSKKEASEKELDRLIVGARTFIISRLEKSSTGSIARIKGDTGEPSFSIEYVK